MTDGTDAFSRVVQSAPGTGIPDAYSRGAFVLGALGETITGTTYTLLKTDNGKTLNFTNGSAITLTVPAGLGKDFVCGIVQVGAGAITPTASGTTINGLGTATSAQWACAMLYAYAANTFVLSGGVA